MAPSVVSEVELPERQVPESSMTPAASHATNKLFSLRGKTVLVTGGGRGIGITLALAIVEGGGNVACLDILESPSADEWTQLTKYAEANKLSATYHKCDVTNEEAIGKVTEEVAKTAESQGAQFWGAVACAGITQQVDALNTTANDFDRIMNVNVTGVFNTCKYAAKTLKSRNNHGSIVIIASMSGNIANRGLHCTAYNSSKAAVQQMCRSLAQEWGKFGIRINSLSPGYIRTAMTDQLLAEKPEVEEKWMAGALLGRLGAPEDFKAPAVFLLSEGSSFVHGTDLRVDGGHTASA